LIFRNKNTYIYFFLVLISNQRYFQPYVMPYFMKKYFLSILTLLIPIFLYCQSDSTKNDYIRNIPFDTEFIGSLNIYVLTNAIYSKQALLDSIEGTVYIAFRVNKDGTISNSKIERGELEDLDLKIMFEKQKCDN